MTWSNAMDARTTVRELDEMIARTRSTTEREAKLVRAVSPQNLKPASLKTTRRDASPNTARNFRTGERSRRVLGTTKS
jgi:hypothetical protein